MVSGCCLKSWIVNRSILALSDDVKAKLAIEASSLLKSHKAEVNELRTSGRCKAIAKLISGYNE